MLTVFDLGPEADIAPEGHHGVKEWALSVSGSNVRTTAA